MPPPLDLRKPPPPPIRKGASQPEDPNEISFLTTLPPEVRNAIYEFAFVQDEPVVIVDAEEYEREAAWDHVPFKADDIGFLIALLRACRQVYHEASGILYGKNMFSISVAPYRHNPGFRQLRTYVLWILCIGSQDRNLASVEIDATGRCPYNCDYNMGFFCITRVIELAWARPELLSRIVFTDSISLASDLRSHQEGPFSPEISARFHGFITRIKIRDDLSGGSVIFASSMTLKGGGMNGLMVPFHIDRRKPDVALCWKPRRDAASLIMPFWTKRYRDIIERAVFCAKPVTFDLDKRQTQGVNLSLLSVSRRWRADAIAMFREQNDMGIKFSKDTYRTSSNTFDALRQWLRHPIHQLFPMDDEDGSPADIAPSVHLYFTKVCGMAILVSLSINVTEFLRLTYRMGPSTHVVCSLSADFAGTVIEVRHSCKLAELRRRCFVFLSWLIVGYPETHIHPCPRIWIDGEMRVVEANWTLGGNKAYNPYQRTDDTQIFALGMQYVGIIENRQDPWKSSSAHQNNVIMESNTLLAMWKSLRDRDWDWRSPRPMPAA
ncbi:hypothetical protein BKA63DRAFT_549058 [Paraphoma chrysanthemicola]|nr:hypothetical protein BKA63DRAFT_549058 [Paraphoma chrysanthemicola]